MAGGTAHATKMSPVLHTLVAQVAGVAIPQISIGSLFGHTIQFAQGYFRHLFQFVGELSRIILCHFLHISFIGLGAETRCRAVRIFGVMVGIDVVVVLCADPPAPEDGFHFAGIGIHIGEVHIVCMVAVALAAGILIYL